ncbi:hypothetical protein [Kribbella sp. NPDC055071]
MILNNRTVSGHQFQLDSEKIVLESSGAYSNFGFPGRGQSIGTSPADTSNSQVWEMIDRGGSIFEFKNTSAFAPFFLTFKPGAGREFVLEASGNTTFRLKTI